MSAIEDDRYKYLMIMWKRGERASWQNYYHESDALKDAQIYITGEHYDHVVLFKTHMLLRLVKPKDGEPNGES